MRHSFFGKRSSRLSVCVVVISSFLQLSQGGADEKTAKQWSLEQAVVGHVSQRDIFEGKWSIDQLGEAGRRLFVARFTTADGVGRPGATANRRPRHRRRDGQPSFTRGAGPDANACISCHNWPDVGGAGDFSSNVFLGLGERTPVKNSFAASFSNERGTPDLHGIGVIELLAREITEDLHRIRNEAIAEAEKLKQPVCIELNSKSISFGSITVDADGTIDFSEIDGIDHDLVIRPFGSKGTIVSTREFTVNALNLHHGMQAEERFGPSMTDEVDFDQDGVSTEMTTGDVTALTLFQVTLNLPGRLLPVDEQERLLVEQGELLFAEMKCSKCHIPELPLRSPIFTEPGPYNVQGTFDNCEQTLNVDLSSDTPSPRLSRNENGKFIVRVFTDFKRHLIADNETPIWANETVVERRISTNEFMTRKLWTVGNTSPYGHRGDITTLHEAILCHGGEARRSRIEYENSSVADQRSVILFLKSLQILPDGSKPIVIDSSAQTLPYQVDE